MKYIIKDFINMDDLTLRANVKVYYSDFVSRAKNYIMNNILEFFDPDIDVMRNKIILFTETAFNIYTKSLINYIGPERIIEEAVTPAPPPDKGRLGLGTKLAIGAAGAYAGYKVAKVLKNEIDRRIAEVERRKLEKERELELLRRDINRLKLERKKPELMMGRVNEEV